MNKMQAVFNKNTRGIIEFIDYSFILISLTIILSFDFNL